MCVYRPRIIETSQEIIAWLHLYFLIAVWEINLLWMVFLTHGPYEFFFLVDTIGFKRYESGSH